MFCFLIVLLLVRFWFKIQCLISMGRPGKYFVTQPCGVNLVISCPHLLKAEAVDEHRTLGAESVVIHEKGIACVMLFRVDCSFKGKLHLFSFSDNTTWDGLVESLPAAVCSVKGQLCSAPRA